MELNPLLREGIEWLLRLKSGSATEADLNACRSWQAQSPAHAEAFREAVRLRRRLRAAGMQLLDRPQPAVQTNGRMSRRALIGGALAASTAGWLALRPPFDLWPSMGDVIADLRADYSTAIGEQRKVAFDAGSLTLNTQTRLAWQTIGDAPALVLMDGEALIEIERDTRRAFTVAAGSGIARIVAGRINIRSVDHKVQLTCVDGRLQVSHGETSVTLGSRQQVSWDEASLGTVTSVDPQLATAWQSGLLIFRNESLRNVVDELNRYRRGKIILANAELEQRLVNATFHLGQMDGAPLQMQQLLGARARSLPGGIVILS